MTRKRVHECNCGKKKNQKKVIVTCESCREALKGSNGRKYPIHIVPVEVYMQQVTEWRNNGYTIDIQQPANNH